MKNETGRLQLLVADESGQSMIEYSLIVVLVGLAATASAHSVGLWLSNFYNLLVSLSQYLQY